MANILQPKWQAANQQTGQSEDKIAPQSSYLQEAHYDSKNYILSITFKSGAQHQYYFVYPVVWQQFLESQSKGQFYAKNIKGQHPSVKVENKNTGRHHGTHGK